MGRKRTLIFFLALAPCLRADDGYRLWLRYGRIADEPLRQAYAAALPQVVLLTPRGADSPTLEAARAELAAGLGGLLGTSPPIAVAADPGAAPAAAGEEGYALRRASWQGRPALLIEARRDAGALYGAFALLRELETARPPDSLDSVSAPRIQRRILDHWDNLDGSQEHGYAGYSIWNWFELPDFADPRYRDYARADASVGINGVVLNNVNADPLILTDTYLKKVAALADVFRPYGIRVYLSPRFSAPIQIGHLKTADPLDPAVVAWWKGEVERIYGLVPDFGGFLVKANSEGQPGPQDYGRTHADGANMMADLLAPHGGIVMWRAFVYGADNHEDRAKQAYDEFRPLDGKFRGNVAIQIKNGPLDFQPREPFHPLFGAMPHTSLGLEVQITQEYLGGSIHLAYLGTMWQEVLRSDTRAAGPGSTVAKIVDGRAGGGGLTVMAGVANVGTDRDWCGHPLASANWYAFGRLAWDDGLDAAAIADEWTRQNFGNDRTAVETIDRMLLASREAVVDYMTPLGLNLIMAHDHHYGPGPWDQQGPRRDWWATYYHRAAADGIGFDRTATGSDALAQYAPEVARRWADLATCPENLLLWFHHVPWDHRMRSGRTLWDELCLHYQHGVDEVRRFQRAWDSLRGRMDDERFEHVKLLLSAQESDARFWRDGCLLYFQTFSHRPLPAGVEPPDHPLGYYESTRLR
ncbi:MAG TPA: alpha-glucuronidase family glycosyl hydrolase [Opitutaceae bacterium]|nr:alpha-glucuronidase family glycosyl hydrolase [Opitutaceae bacterium]